MSQCLFKQDLGQEEHHHSADGQRLSKKCREGGQVPRTTSKFLAKHYSHAPYSQGTNNKNSNTLTLNQLVN